MKIDIEEISNNIFKNDKIRDEIANKIVFHPDWINYKFRWTKEELEQLPTLRKEEFQEHLALAYLLYHEIVFLNSFWWYKDNPLKESISINVNCSDVFAWGCADAEELDYKDLEELYNMVRKDPANGSIVWCCIKRNELPQKPVLERILENDIWDIMNLGLKPNSYDYYCSVAFDQFSFYNMGISDELLTYKFYKNLD
jgi:hypothetical protein